MDTLKALGKRIVRLRQKIGISQEQLAERAGMSWKNLSQWENGRGDPKLSSLVRLSNALDVTLSELFDIESELFSLEEVRNQVCENIGKTTEEESRLYYRLLRVLMK